MSILLAVIFSNLLCRIAALFVAGFLSVRFLSRCGRIVAQLACGMLIAVSLLHLIPEAFESGIGFSQAALTIVCSGAFLFLLDYLADRLFGHLHAETLVRPVPALLGGGHEIRTVVCTAGVRRSLPVLIGSAFHNFVDGVLVAAAFMTSFTAGVVLCVAVFSHEVPQLIGQIAILRRFSMSEKEAFISLSLVATIAVIGGIGGVLLFSSSAFLIPYAMLVSSSAFLFVAFFLVREDFFQCKLPKRELLRSLAFVVSGVLISSLILSLGHV